jgi:hypothetical protein
MTSSRWTSPWRHPLWWVGLPPTWSPHSGEWRTEWRLWIQSRPQESPLLSLAKLICVLNLVGNRSVSFVTVSCTGGYALRDGCRTGSVSRETPLCPHCHLPMGSWGTQARNDHKSLNGMMLKHFYACFISGTKELNNLYP